MTEMLATFSENVLSNDIMAKPVDGREHLYSHNKYIPVSSLTPLFWSAGDNDLKKFQISLIKEIVWFLS